MAQRVVTQMTDDLDPSQEADVTVRFGWDGSDYEIDLTKEHADDLRQALERFVDAGRRVGRRTGRGGARKSQSDMPVDGKAVRAWARSNGIELSSRGRIPASVVEQFKSAMG